jgi:hypothetical protein
MTKWEYQVEVCDPPELVDKLTELGEYGWEVVSIVVAVYSTIDGPGHKQTTYGLSLGGMAAHRILPFRTLGSRVRTLSLFSHAARCSSNRQSNRQGEVLTLSGSVER